MGERGLQSCTLLPQAGGGGTASNTPGLDVPPLSCCSSVGQVGGPPTPTPGMLRGGGRGTRPTSPCDSSDAGAIACGWGSAGQASACPIVPALPWGTAAGNGPLSPTGCPRAQSKGGSCAVLCCAGGVPGCRRGRCTPSARSKSTAEKVRLCVKGLQDHVCGKALSKDSLRVQKSPAQPMPCKTTAGPKAASQRSRDGGQGRGCWECCGAAPLSPLRTAWHVVRFRSVSQPQLPHCGSHPQQASAAGPAGFSWKS